MGTGVQSGGGGGDSQPGGRQLGVPRIESESVACRGYSLFRGKTLFKACMGILSKEGEEEGMDCG